jgi:chorismate mutase
MYLRGIRGAITVTIDDRESILEATAELLETMMRENEIVSSDLTSVFLTMTPDLHSVFPAVAAREKLNWTEVPLMCGAELDIEGGLPRCIRALFHWNTTKSQEDIRHVYLRDAKKLRPDI